MFIKSKHKHNEDIQNMSMCTPFIVEPRSIKLDGVFQYLIEFNYHMFVRVWYYESEEDQLNEYNFILSQLDCRVNDGKPKNTMSEPLNTKYIMKTPLEIFNHHMATIETGEIVLSINNADKLPDDNLCRIKYMDTVFWCDTKRLKRLK